MRSLTAEDMLIAWERGLNRSMLQKSLILLAAAFPEMNSEMLAELSIGHRDMCMFLLRERLFGSRLVNNAVCPQCATRIEWEQEIADFLADAAEIHVGSPYFSLTQDGYDITFRLPNSLDLAHIEGIDNAQIAEKQLLRRCILSAQHADDTLDAAQLPENIVQALTSRIEALDPQADVRIKLTCPECSHDWEVLFDIAGFLWSEIDAWAERMLQTVHKLARTYGWTEREILALSPVRRQLYLGMAGL